MSAQRVGRTGRDEVRERDERDARFFAWDVPGDAHIVALVHDVDDAERSATVADAIATSVARRREHTLLLSADPGPSPLDELLGGADSPGLPAALQGRVRLTDVAVQRVDRPFVYLPGGSDGAAIQALLDDELLASFVERVRERGGTLFIVLSETALLRDGLRSLIDGYVALGEVTLPPEVRGLKAFGRVRFEESNGTDPEDGTPVATPAPPDRSAVDPGQDPAARGAPAAHRGGAPEAASSPPGVAAALEPRSDSAFGADVSSGDAASGDAASGNEAAGDEAAGEVASGGAASGDPVGGGSDRRSDLEDRAASAKAPGAERPDPRPGFTVATAPVEAPGPEGHPPAAHIPTDGDAPADVAPSADPGPLTDPRLVGDPGPVGDPEPVGDAEPVGAAEPGPAAEAGADPQPSAAPAARRGWGRHRTAAGLPVRGIGLAAAAVVGLVVVWWLFADVFAGDGAPDSEVAAPAAVPAAPLTAPPFDAGAGGLAFDAAAALPYSVAIASYADRGDAEERLARLSAAGAGLFFISPTPVRGIVYHRVLAGALAERDAAAVLMNDLVDSGRKDVAAEWDVRPTRLSFDLGVFGDRGAADARVAFLQERSVPAYVLSAPHEATEAWRVYGGAYESERASEPMAELIRGAGEEPRLIDRRGSERDPTNQ